jgi:nitrite reductase (NO-forming)
MASMPGMAGAHDMSNAPVGGEKVEPFRRVDPTLPAVPAGAVKKFDVDVYEHVTQVSKDLPATRVWSYAINGVFHRGSGVSQPMVVNQGDTVQITLNNGLQKAMQVQYPHSIDLHSAEVAPNEDYKTIAPGQSYTFRFKADHPGVFMYHCATDPVLMHTAAGMVGMMVVRPAGLAPVDKELWITQQEFYLGPRVGDNADMAKAQAKQPDVIAFNGYANQYQQAPISVKPGERIRMYVLNAGPSLWTAFHVIGSVFDKTDVEGVIGHDAQTISLAPSQGGYVEFTLDKKGTYPFVDHAFADMGKGAAGVLAAGVPATPTMGH